MPTAALELNYLKLQRTNAHGSNTGHTVVMTHVRAKHQVIRVPTGAACGVKSIADINNLYTNIVIANLLARSLPPIQSALE